MHLVGGAPGNASAYVTGFDQASFMIGTVSSLFNVRPPPSAVPQLTVGRDRLH